MSVVEKDRYRGSYHPDSITCDILDGVAEVTGENRESLGPLYPAVDADAIAALFEKEAPDSQTLSFEFEGCRITILGSGELVIGKLSPKHSSPLSK
jgi:hypothetical protein